MRTSILKTMDPTAGAVVAAARGWLGTPYRHQQSRRGVGCDCLGLVRGVWRDLYGVEPEVPGSYDRFEDPAPMGEATPERLLAAAARHGIAVPDFVSIAAGQMLLFRWRRDLPARHIGIATGPSAFIHAYSGVGTVESALVESWRRRIAARFTFPLIEGDR